MASSEVDLKHLARISVAIERVSPLLASSLRQIEGNSIMLAPRLYRARRARRLDSSRDSGVPSNCEHILWLAREGLSILEVDVLPYTQLGQHGPDAAVLTTKLRASFLHIFALFHNQPSAPANGRAHRHAATKASRTGDAQTHTRANKSRPKDLGGPEGSEASFVTNPYATAPPPYPPPGLPDLPPVPRPSSSILPAMNILPMTESYFAHASRVASACLAGSHPLRLSVEVEHCAFIWDCLHNHQHARRLARQTIRDVYHTTEGMDDEDFEDAAMMVDHLGKVMKRNSIEANPNTGVASSAASGVKGNNHIIKSEWKGGESRAPGSRLHDVVHCRIIPCKH